MLSEFAATLPLALGIAISPIPLIATVLMLLSKNGRSASLGFVAGWMAGIVAVITIVGLIAAQSPHDVEEQSRPVLLVLRVLVGIGLLVLSWRQWRARPRPGQAASLPKWMAAVDTMGPGKAALLAFLLAAVNPKNLLLAVSGGVALSRASQPVVAGVGFVLVASASVGGIVIAHLVAGARMAPALRWLRAWLEQNSAVVMSLLLLVLGTMAIGNALIG